MNKPTEEQIREVLAGTSTPETARLVAQWFATDGRNGLFVPKHGLRRGAGETWL